MDKRRRHLLMSGLFGAGHVGLRAMATGVPAWFLANPLKATAQDLACALSNAGRAQFLIASTSSAGCPLNCNVPGTYGNDAIIHPAVPEFAPTPIVLGGKTVVGAKVWSGLSDAVRARTNFFHHATLSTVHGDQPKVLKLLGLTAGNEMLPTLYAKHLAPCLGTVQTAPIAVGALGNSLEQLTFSGRPLASISPLQLKELLTGDKANPLVRLRSLRDSTLNELSALFKQNGTKEQVAFLNAMASSQDQVRKLADGLSETLASITDVGVESQAHAAAALIAAKVTPVVTIRIPFGLDNHEDAGLANEVFQTADKGNDKTGVPGVQAVMDALASLGLQDAATFATMNVFGRTLSGTSKVKARNGRDHLGLHAVMVMIGKNISGGVTGGVTEIGNGVFGAAPIGGVARADTHIAAAKTLGVALGIDAARLDRDFTDSGRVKAVVLG
ncbi:MAG TPA: DUF1501 domain-containing protein [Burkholderiaceae bacterium]|nr:DUF1501 domain-containing protein [Burkholderiaceae bacterium]